MKRLPFPDDLAPWVQGLLRGSGGNEALADGLLLEPRSYFGPLFVGTAEVNRCCGPEPGMAYPVTRASFETRVEGLLRALRQGERLPPLILNFTGGRFVLNDGNHRHEALVRAGFPSFPAIVWTTGEDDRQAFLEAFGPWLTVDRGFLEGQDQGRQGVVGCLVYRDHRLFAQRRSSTRKLFPGCWDLVGGHIEPGEGPRQALVRELKEETGWDLDRILGLRKVVDWESPGADGRPVPKREFVLAVTVTGTGEPVLETGKVSEARWFGPQDLPILNENRPETDRYVHDLFREFFEDHPSAQEEP